MQEHETDGLTLKQRMFCHEYLIDLNATQSAIRAGYSENAAGSIGHENLKKPEIQSKIQALMDLRAKRCDITADRVLVELSKLAFSDIRKIFSDTNSLIDPSEYDDDIAAAVQSVEIVVRSSDNDDEHVHKIKLADKRPALEALGKNLKLFNERIEHDVSDPLADLLQKISGNTIAPK